MKYIVALGNPGSEYEHTRHNVGWDTANAILEHYNFPEPVFNAKYQSRISNGDIKSVPVMVLYPDTFMNHSGVVAKKLGLTNPAEELIVLQDEVDLPLGEIKISIGRGHGGHNGIRSITEHLGTNEFVRVRIGISPVGFFTRKIKRPEGDKLPKFVLGKFTKKEQLQVREVSVVVAEAVEMLVQKGLPAAMNRFN